MTPARLARLARRALAVPDPARSLRARQNLLTGQAAEAEWLLRCLRDGAIAADRVGANTDRRRNHDLWGLWDAVIAWPDRVTFDQVRATAQPPNLLAGQWTALRRLPDLATTHYRLVWLTPAGEWRRWRLYPDGRRVPEGAEDADALAGRGEGTQAVTDRLGPDGEGRRWRG